MSSAQGQPELHTHLESLKDETERLLELVGVVDRKLVDKLAESKTSNKEKESFIRRECEDMSRLKIDLLRQVREGIALMEKEIDKEIQRVLPELSTNNPNTQGLDRRQKAALKHKKKKGNVVVDQEVAEKNCPCGQTDNPNQQILCEKCLQWYHVDCAGLTFESIPTGDTLWFCDNCATQSPRK